MELISVWRWFWILMLLSIPIVNVVLLIFWAFGGGSQDPNVTNFCRALIIWFLIGIVLALLSGTI